MNTLMLCAAIAIAPAQCACWHARRLQRWPGTGRAVASTPASALSLALMALGVGLVWFGSRSIALSIVLPLSALAVAGMAYVSLVAYRPRSALGLSVAAAAGAAVLVALA